MTIKKALPIAALLASVMFAMPARAQCGAVAGNLVVNCGFETGDFTDWTGSGTVGFNAISTSPYAHSGVYGWAGGSLGAVDYITQDLVTVAGQSYDFSFYYQAFGAYPNELVADWNGGTLLDATNVGAPSGTGGWVLYTFDVAATSTSTEIDLGIRNDNGFDAIDDISVAPTPTTSATPEPATLALFATGLFGVCGVAARRRRCKS